MGGVERGRIRVRDWKYSTSAWNTQNKSLHFNNQIKGRSVL